MFTFNEQLKALAQDMDIPVTESQVTTADVMRFQDQGANVFIAAGYPYKIPPIDEARAYALNVHPALLPKGRGIMPLPSILMHAPDAAGVSVHKMTDVFDDGDILLQEALPIDHTTDVEILSARISMRSPEMVSVILQDMPRYWRDAKPQDRAQSSYFPPPDEALRTLDWMAGVEDLNLKSCAFGRFGVLAHIQGQSFVVFNFKGWKEAHNNAPGDVLLSSPREIVVAVKDGYVCLKEFQPLGP
jgi:methionyl-tRNA formyltransferase